MVMFRVVAVVEILDSWYIYIYMHVILRMSHPVNGANPNQKTKQDPPTTPLKINIRNPKNGGGWEDEFPDFNLGDVYVLCEFSRV